MPRKTNQAISIGRVLGKKRKTFALAESCTGGYISHLVTANPGSSAYFKGSVVAYGNEAKQDILKVKTATLKRFGAVSAECANEMVKGVRKRFKADYALATTGIAGPGGAVRGKAVGIVYIAVAGSNQLLVERCQF